MAKSTSQNKFLRIISMPIRALAKARDFYERSMNNLANGGAYYAPPTGWSGTAYGSDPLPRSFTTTAMRSSEKEDYRELVRAASTSTLGNRVDLGSVSNSSTRKVSSSSSSSSNNSTSLLNQHPKRNASVGFRGVPRSASVSMAKIEEDKPSEFDELDHHGKASNNGSAGIKQKFRLFPRSRSYAAGAAKRSHIAVS